MEASIDSKGSTHGKLKQPTEVWKRGQPIQKKRLREEVDWKPLSTYYQKGPGPAGYLLPSLTGKRKHDITHLIMPEYTMRPYLRSSFLMSGLVGPGAGYYMIPEKYSYHGKAPSFAKTFGRKYDSKYESSKAGPGSHTLPNPDVYLYRMGRAVLVPYRPYFRKPFTDALYIHGPMIGPKVVERIAAQEVTIKGGFKKAKEEALGPGPAYYIKSPEPRPAFTMRARLNPPEDTSTSVGPKYSLEYVKNGPRAPAWKLGIKHNEFTGVFRFPCDKVDHKNLDILR